MRSTLLPLSFAAALGFFSSVAGAHPDHPREEIVSMAAHQTVSNLRHRWDKARIEDPTLAACLESKVMQAISVARRVDEHVRALREGREVKGQERDRRLAAVERLAERRAELATEASLCSGRGDEVAPVGKGTQVLATANGNIAAVDPQVPDDLEALPPTVLAALRSLR